jgi:pimeloyl-ACP methyl ester carboxylesterase
VLVRVGDVRLFFDVEGAKLVPDGARLRERPTLVLLHGGPGFDHSSFKPLFSRLADAAQMVAMAYSTRHPDHPTKLVLSSTCARQRLDRVPSRASSASRAAGTASCATTPRAGSRRSGPS